MSIGKRRLQTAGFGALMSASSRRIKESMGLWGGLRVVPLLIGLWCSDAAAQLPTLPELMNVGKQEDSSAVSLVVGDRCRLARRDRASLKEHREALALAIQEIEDLKQRKTTYRVRRKEVEAAMADLTETLEEAEQAQAKRGEQGTTGEEAPPLSQDAGPSPDITHSAYSSALGRLRDQLEIVIEKIEAIENAVTRERLAISRGETQAEALISACNAPASDASGGAEQKTSLSRALSVSHALYLAKLELSLARSRGRNVTTADDARHVDTDEAEAAPDNSEGVQPALEPGERVSGSRQEARVLREEIREIRADVARLDTIRLRWIRSGTEVRKLVSRLTVLEKERQVDELEAALDRTLSRVRVTREALSDGKAEFESRTEALDDEKARVRKKIAALRRESPATGRITDRRFTEKHVREFELEALRERLTNLELESEYARFKLDSIQILFDAQAGTPPKKAFLDRHRELLDSEMRRKRVDEVGKRLKAWRRQRVQLQQRHAPPKREDNKARILERLSEITELCAKQENTLAAFGRLADIVRFHLRRFEKQSHGVWWYIARGAASLLLFLIGVAVSYFGSRGMLRLSARLNDRFERWLSHGGSDRRRGLLRRTQRMLRYVIFAFYLLCILSIWLGVAYLAVGLIWEVDLGFERLRNFMSTSLFMIEDTEIRPTDIVKLVVVLILTVIGSRLVQMFLRHQVFHFFEWDEGIRHAVSVVLRYGMILIGFSMGLQYLGLGLEMFAVLLGVVGIGIGFGLQKLANSFASGFVILFGRPVKKGDFVTAGELEGQILEVSMRTTTVRTRDNVSVIIPNNELVSQKVINWSHEDPKIRLRVPVGVAYGSDIETVEQALLAAANDHPAVLAEPPAQVWFRAFGDSALSFELLVWTHDAAHRYGLISDLNKRIDAGFRSAGIAIPFPQRDLHLRSVEPGIGFVDTRPVNDDKSKETK